MTATDAAAFRQDSPPPLPAQPSGAVVEYDNPQHKNWSSPTRLMALPEARESRADRWFWTLVALALAALYLYALLSFWAPANPGTDQNGYYAGGRQFAHTLSTGLKPASDYNFVGRMWVTAPSGVNYPKYPLGMPILAAICIWVFGERGYEYAHLIPPVATVLATLGVFAITRRIAGGFVGVMAMLLLACGQTTLTLAVNPLSHAACTCTVVWGIFFLLRWLQTGAIWRGILAGALFGFAYMIRYTEGLLLLPLGVAMLYAARWKMPGVKRLAITLGATLLVVSIAAGVATLMRNGMVDPGWLKPLGEENGRPFKLLLTAVSIAAITSAFIEARSLVRLLAVGLAWLIPVLYLTIFNMVNMESFTSYAGTNESTGFGGDYFYGNWEKMIRVLHDQGLFFIAPIGVLGLVMMARRLPMVAAILALWFVPSVLLYTAYYWAPDNMGVAYSRFVVSQMPALIIAAAWFMGELARRPMRNATGRIAIGLVVFISCALGIHRTLLGSEWGQRLTVRANLQIQARQNMNLHGLGREVRRAVDGSPKQKAARVVKDDSDVLLFTEGERLNHFQWLGGWQLFDVGAFNYERATRQFSRTINENEPDPIDPTRMKFLQGVYKGKDQRALQAEQNALIANALKAGKRVFFALSDSQSKVFGRQIDRRQFEVKEVGTYNDVPSPRTADDFLLPNERPKLPINRFGRGTAFGGPNFLGNERNFYRIGQVTLKQTAATAPATTRTTQP